MYYNFVYKNKETGKTVYSQNRLDDENLNLVSQTKNASMKADEVTEKADKKK